MSEKQLNGQSQPDLVLCANQCGFFGSATTNNLCSKCFKESIARKQQQAAGDAATTPTKLGAPPAPASAPITPAAAPAAAPTTPASSSANSSDVSAMDVPSSPAPAPQQQAQQQPPTPSSEAPAPAPSQPEPVAAPAAATAAPAAAAADASVAPAPAQPAGPATPAKRAADVAAVPAAEAPAAAAAAAISDMDVTPPPAQKRTRCFVCSKKVGLTGIECRCRNVFCSVHRYPESHGCTFDFKASDRQTLEKSLAGGGGHFTKVERL